MRVSTPKTEPDDWINPRGGVAKSYEKVAKRCVWAILLCEVWLHYHEGNEVEAMYTVPSELPSSFPHSKRLKEAMKGSGLWERGTKESKRTRPKELKDGTIQWYRGNRKLEDVEIHDLPAAPPGSGLSQQQWQSIFTGWLNGSLHRQLEVITAWLPQANREAIEEERAK